MLVIELLNGLRCCWRYSFVFMSCWIFIWNEFIKRDVSIEKCRRLLATDRSLRNRYWQVQLKASMITEVFFFIEGTFHGASSISFHSAHCAPQSYRPATVSIET